MQNEIDNTNAEEAIAALTNAAGDELAEGVTQADVDAAQALIDVLPEDYYVSALDTILSNC